MVIISSIQVSKLWTIVNNLWESDNKIDDLENESKDLIKQFCEKCNLYIKRNINIFNSIQSNKERKQFILDWILEMINIIWPSKFKIVLWKKFDILDTIEEYSKELYQLIIDYDIDKELIKYFNKYI